MARGLGDNVGITACHFPAGGPWESHQTSVSQSPQPLNAKRAPYPLISALGNLMSTSIEGVRYQISVGDILFCHPLPSSNSILFYVPLPSAHQFVRDY